MKHRWIALALAAFVACDRPATQIVVRVDSDMREGDELRAVRVSMRRVGATADSFDRTYDLTGGEFHIPGTLGVVPGDPDDERRLEVTVRATLPSDEGFSTRALVSFQREETLFLDLYLASRCRDPANRAGCGPDETCGPDGCEPVSRPALPGFTLDAARRDVPAVEEDAADDLALDVAPDESDVTDAPEEPEIPCGPGLTCCDGGALCDPTTVCTTGGTCARCGVGATCCDDGVLCGDGRVCASAGGVAACAPCGAAGSPCCAGDACGAGLQCAAGVCRCGGPGQPCCMGSGCGAGLVCSSGACVGCGASGGPCCGDGSCAAGSVCANNACVPCGGSGQPCCAGGACGASLTCAAGRCACGGSGQACCNGATCGAGLVCASGSCAACGASGQLCCAGSACGAGLACASGRCAVCGGVGQPCCAGRTCAADANPCARVTCNASSVCARSTLGDGASAGPRAEQRCCGGVAVDISTNPRHCGGCGMVCGTGSCEPLEAIPCGGSANVSGRCRCTGANAQCPVGAGGTRQVCRGLLPYNNRCAPANIGACAAGEMFFSVSSCPNYCRY